MGNAHQALTPLIEDFISKLLFEREVDLYSGEVDHRMRDMDVMEHVRATFTPLILRGTVQKKKRKRISRGQSVSAWKPYQATSTPKRPAVPGQRTMFNLVPCENDFEQAFTDFCDFAGDVAAFAKNAGPQKLMIDYLRPDGHRAFYTPDFFVRCSAGSYYLVELKGKVDALVPVKACAAVQWCKAASKGKTKWRYLYVPYHLFQQSAAAEIEELARACEPSLKAILGEAETGQQELPLFEATARKEAEELLSRVMEQAGISEAPESVAGSMRQSVLLLDHAVRSGVPDYAHAFQPLLGPLDDYSLRILEKRLGPRIPKDDRSRRDYFSPYLGSLSSRDRSVLAKNQRYLEHNLVFGRSIMKLGTLLFCLRYAQGEVCDAPGMWKDVENVFAGKEMESLYEGLDSVNGFRNKHVAHVEERLTDAEEAWEAMEVWLRCLDRMAKLI